VCTRQKHQTLNLPGAGKRRCRRRGKRCCGEKRQKHDQEGDAELREHVNVLEDGILQRGSASEVCEVEGKTCQRYCMIMKRQVGRCICWPTSLSRGRRDPITKLGVILDDY